MPYEIVRNDITNMIVDAIVNTANPLPIVGSGVDHAIHQKAGPELLKEREKIGRISVGESKITPAFHLDAKYVIHTVSPKWVDGKHNEEKQLYAAYQSALSLGLDNNCTSIAFPLMASGVYKFPKDLALEVALNAFHGFLTKHDMMIYLVIFDLESFNVSSRLFNHIQICIDEEYVNTAKKAEYFNTSQLEEYKIKEKKYSDLYKKCRTQNKPDIDKLSLFVNQKEETYYERFTRVVDERGWKDSKIYNKAHISRQIISKLRNNPSYKMTKKNLMALTYCLELDLDETQDLLSRGDYALNPAKRSDRIYIFCVMNRVYSTAYLDELLYMFGEDCLFSEE